MMIFLFILYSIAISNEQFFKNLSSRISPRRRPWLFATVSGFIGTHNFGQAFLVAGRMREEERGEYLSTVVTGRGVSIEFLFRIIIVPRGRSYVKIGMAWKYLFSMHSIFARPTRSILVVFEIGDVRGEMVSRLLRFIRG